MSASTLAELPESIHDHALHAARRGEAILQPLIEEEIASWSEGPIARSPECGRHRLALPIGTPVSEWRKVPITSEGAVANHIEARVSRRYWAAVEAGRPWDLEPGAMPVARCRLTESGVLVMEPVRIERDWDSITEHRWWTASVDCCQVGWTDDGHLVAYDL